MWAMRQERFPEFTPRNKEYYLLRSIFEKHFPSRSALHMVPQVGRGCAPGLWLVALHCPPPCVCDYARNSDVQLTRC